MSFFDTIRDKCKEFFAAVAEWCKPFTAYLRSCAQEKSLKRELRKLYARLGEFYVETKGADTGACAAMVKEAEGLKAQIEALVAKRPGPHKKNLCPVCRSVVPKTARFCPVCGSALVEAGTKIAAETPVESVAESVPEPERESIVIKPLTFDKEDNA